MAKGAIIATIGGSGYGKADYYGVHSHFEVKAAPVLANPSGSEIYYGYTPSNPTAYGYFDPALYINNVSVVNSVGLTGVWEGVFTQPEGPYVPTFGYKLTLQQDSIGSVKGTSEMWVPGEPDIFAVQTVSGIVSNQILSLREGVIQFQRTPSGITGWCIKSGELKFSSDGDGDHFRGNWQAASSCPPGAIYVTR